MTEKRICRNFIKNPKEDPFDGHRLVPGKGPYRGYIAMCMENGFDVEYMLDDDFINELSGKPKRNIEIPRSPKSSALRSPLRSQPMLPTRSFEDERSVRSIIKPDNLPTRSFSDKRFDVITPQATQTLYPRVVGPSRVPTPSYTERSEQIGTERFDPDPITTVTEIPQRVIRDTVQGPYGNSGENTVISGVRKLPGQRVYSTVDIPEHEVRSASNAFNGSNAYNGQSKRALLPPPSVITRSEQIGVETFDPDPITTVTEIPQRTMRDTVQGPYGNNGENTVISGVRKLPGQRVYSTVDIPEHEVRSVHDGYNTLPILNNSNNIKPVFNGNIRPIVNNTLSVTGGRPLINNTLATNRPLFNIPLTTNNVPSINNSLSVNNLLPTSIVNNVVQTPKKVLLPAPSIRTRVEKIGVETFDPDPITTVSDMAPIPVRTTVAGPYGRVGENVITTGVYTPPGRRVYSTRDIPEHEVRSIPRQVRSDEF